jgi:hypothetical protein
MGHRWMRQGPMLSPTVSDGHTWIACANHASGLIVCHNTSRCHHRFSADRDSRGHKTLRSDPRAILDHNGLIAIGEVRMTVIMVARAKKGALGNTTMRADGHRLKIENEHFLADPGKISDRQFPREMNVNPRFQDDSTTNRGAKESEHRTLERGRVWTWGQENQTLDKVPEGFA